MAAVTITQTSAPLLAGTASSVFCSWSEAATNMSEKPIAWWTEDGKPILIHIDIDGKAHYPPKPKITQTKPGHYDCHF